MNDKFAIRLLRVALAITLFTAAALTQSQAATKKVVVLKDAKGNDVGTATIIPKGKGVEVNLALKDLHRANTPFTFTRMRRAIRPISNPPADTSIPQESSTDLRIPTVITPQTCPTSR